jgi:alpha-tubulin suppressor-like RCC1 family protein
MRLSRAVMVGVVWSGLVAAAGGCVGDDNTVLPGVDASLPSIDGSVPPFGDVASPPADAGSDTTTADVSDAGGPDVDASDAPTNLGDSSTADAGLHPLTNVVAISGPGETANHASTAFCAILADGSARCWGSNSYGQIGLGAAGVPPIAAYAMKPAGLSSGVTAIAVGDDHACAIEAVDGSTATLCWGDNTYGQLGNGTMGDDAGVYVPTVGSATLAGATAIVSGGSASCAIVSTETYCWGANVYGNVCDDSSPPQDTPYSISLSVTQVALGLHGLGLSSGIVYSWGRDDYGQLGRTTLQTCTAASVPCDQNWAQSAINANATYVAVGGLHSCAIVSGQAQCFGDDRNGQLGDGTTTASPVSAPVTVQGLAGVPVQLALGAQFSCALITGGTVQCWGDATIGEGDAGDAGLALAPVTILTGATAIAAGDYTACARMSDTTVKCWGRNVEGELGIGTGDSNAHGPTTVLTSQ